MAGALDFSSIMTREQLGQQGLNCPKIDDDLLRRYLRNFIDSGFLVLPRGEFAGAIMGRESCGRENRQGGID